MAVGDLFLHIGFDLCRRLLVRKPQVVALQAVVFIYAIRSANDQMLDSLHIEDIPVPCKEQIRVFILIPNRAAVPLLLLLAGECSRPPLMVTVNTENGRFHSGEGIFAVPVPIIAVVIGSDVSEDDEYI